MEPRRISIEAFELFGPDNELGEPTDGHSVVRAVFTVEDGKITGISIDQEGTHEPL